MSVRKDEVQLSIEINGVKAGTTLNQLKQNARDLARELSKLAPGTEEFAKKAAELQKVNNVLATIRKTTQGVSGDVGKAGNVFVDIFKKGAVAAAAFFTVDRVITWGKELVSWLIKGSAAIELSGRKTRAVFKDATDIVEDFAQINAKAVGQTVEQYTDLVTATGAVLTGLKFTREEAARMGADVANLSAVLAEWSQGTKTTEQSNKDLNLALTGNVKILKEYGIVITKTDIQNRLATRGQENLVGMARKQAEATATLQLILERTTDAQDAFANNQDAMARSGGRLLTSLGNLTDNILKIFMPAIKAASNAIADLISPKKEKSDILADQQERFQILLRTLIDGNVSQTRRNELIKEANTLFPDFLKNINLETASVNELKGALETANDEFERQIRIQVEREKNSSLVRTKIANETKIDDIAGQIAAAEKIGEDLSKNRKDAITFGVVSIEKQLKANGDLIIRLQSQVNDLRDANKAIDAEITASDNRLKGHGIDLQGEKEARDKLAAEAREAQAKEEARLQAEKDAEEARKREAEAEKARQIRLKNKVDEIDAARALELGGLQRLVLDEVEFNDRKTVIDLTAEKFKLKAKLQLLKLSEEQQIIIAQEIADKEIEIEEATAKLSLDNTLRHIKETGVLQRQAIKQNITDQIEQQEALDLQRLEEEIKLLDAKVKAGEASQDELDAALERKHKLLLAQNEREYKASLTAIRIAGLKALEQQGLDEEDFLIAKRQLTLKYAIEDKEAEIATYKEGTQERYDAEVELAKLIADLNGTTFKVKGPDANGGGSSDQADLDRRKETLQQIEDASISTAQNIANAQLNIARNRIEQELNAELQLINEIENRKLEAAGGDVVAQKKIRAQADRDRLAAERRAAIERKKIAVNS